MSAVNTAGYVAMGTIGEGARAIPFPTTQEPIPFPTAQEH